MIVEAELRDLAEIAGSRGWPLSQKEPSQFVIKVPAKDSVWYALTVDCTKYPELPPAFEWIEPDTSTPGNTPHGSGYLHGSGVICAPWNRLAYREVDSRGPHSDWQLVNWKENGRTGGTKTLAAMVLRIHRELNGPLYRGGNR